MWQAACCEWFATVRDVINVMTFEVDDELIDVDVKCDCLESVTFLHHVKLSSCHAFPSRRDIYTGIYIPLFFIHKQISY